jgi:hypothetical protein
MLSVNIFSLISNKMLISLHRCLDSTHTNCHVATRDVFNYILYDYSFYIICFDNQGYYLSIAKGSDR